MQAIPAHMARGHPSSDTISSAEETISVSLIYHQFRAELVVY